MLKYFQLKYSKCNIFNPNIMTQYVSLHSLTQWILPYMTFELHTKKKSYLWKRFDSFKGSKTNVGNYIKIRQESWPIELPWWQKHWRTWTALRNSLGTCRCTCPFHNNLRISEYQTIINQNRFIWFQQILINNFIINVHM